MWRIRTVGAEIADGVAAGAARRRARMPLRGMLLPVEVPETLYAKSGDLHIACQVAGGGPRDILVPTTL
jgi:hypothetical protein